MLEIKNLYKKFGRKAALTNVSFRVEKGQIYGLLGHNGAGKSTTLGIILAMIEPNQGDVTIGGVSVLEDRASALRKVGAIFESPSFYEYLTGWQNLRLLINYSGKFDDKQVQAVVESVDLTDRIHHKVGSYSHGMRQRLALAQALLPEPEILLLDEPTDGLDPEGIKWFRDFIINLRDERGMTVLFNSHLLNEVEQMCDRVAIIKQGRLVHDGDVSSIDNDEPSYSLIAEPRALVAEVLSSFGGQWTGLETIELPASVDPAVLNTRLVGAGVTVSQISPRRRTLEDFYLSVGQRQSV